MQKKRNRTYNGRLFKARRAYSFDEIAEKLNTHVGTIHRWHKEGLKILNDGSKPFLAMGHAIRDFLKTRLGNRKRSLRPGEFYCSRCRDARKSRPDRMTATPTGRRLGRLYWQVIVRGNCEVCGQTIMLFSSDRMVAEWVKMGLLPPEPMKVINGSEVRSVNADIMKGRQNGERKP